LSHGIKVSLFSGPGWRAQFLSQNTGIVPLSFEPFCPPRKAAAAKHGTDCFQAFRLKAITIVMTSHATFET
jgi:hypothetical protein